MSEAQKIKEKYERDLLAIKGVVGVGYNGSINVYVEKVTPQISSFIPRALEGVVVRVIETGKVKLLSFPIVESAYESRVGRVRPLIGGISVGHPEVTAGTLTSAVIDRNTKRRGGISNNHVIALQWGEASIGKKGDAILQPGTIDGGTMNDKVGELERWERVYSDKPNLIDAAMFFPSININGVDDIGVPSHAVDSRIGISIKKSGRTSGLTFSRIIDLSATIKVEGYGEAVFADQIVAKPSFALPGDSGSWVGNENDESIGIVCAGSTEITIINKAKNVERILGVDFAPVLGYIPVWQVLTPIPAAVIGIGLTKMFGGK